jgi:hypothetical protein
VTLFAYNRHLIISLNEYILKVIKLNTQFIHIFNVK